MYDFNGFGQRLQKRRKDKKMTQEELATRVNVTGQAVSKWETDQSYPDITLIPSLAEILETDIDYLFGKKEELMTTLNDNLFPKTYESLPFVHSNKFVACYSNKEVISKDATGVKFSDGSYVELSNNLIVNSGIGEIKLLLHDDIHTVVKDTQESNEIITKNFEFECDKADYINSIDIMILSNECSISRSPDNKTRVKATGELKLIERLMVELEDKTLNVKFAHQNSNNTNNNNSRNKVEIEVPFESGKSAKINVMGSGTLNSGINFFEEGTLIINGSGILNTTNFGILKVSINGSGIVNSVEAKDTKLSINGSGTLNCSESENTKVTINGSGSYNIDKIKNFKLRVNGSGEANINEVTDGSEVSISIAGSGNVDINQGSCEKFNVNLSGCGDINASGLTAKTATIEIHQDGIVTLGRVLESSTERVKKGGKVNILKRGA